MKFRPMLVLFLFFMWPGPVKSLNYENLCQMYMSVVQSKYGATPDVDDYLACLRDPGKWRSDFIADLTESRGGFNLGGGGGGGGGGAGASNSEDASDEALMDLCRQSVTKSDQFANSNYFNFMDMSVVQDGNVSTVSGRADVMNNAGVLEEHEFTCDVQGNKVVDLRLRGG